MMYGATNANPDIKHTENVASHDETKDGALILMNAKNPRNGEKRYSQVGEEKARTSATSGTAKRSAATDQHTGMLNSKAIPCGVFSQCPKRSQV